jgi:hypothetical protein
MLKDLFTAIAIVLCIAVIAALIGGIILWGKCPTDIGTSLTNGWYYAKSARVVEIDRDADVVTFEDCMGNLWDWEGVEDWTVDDDAALLMNSKGTETIFDDEIISAKFENWA